MKNNTFWFTHRQILNKIRCDYTVIDKNGKPMNGEFAGIEKVHHNDREIWGIIKTDLGLYTKFRYTVSGKRLTYGNKLYKNIRSVK